MFNPGSSARAIALALMSAALLASPGMPVPARAAEPSHDKMSHEEMMKKMKMTPAEFMKMDPAECMKMMDEAHKGFVTKKEYMKFQERLFDNIPKKKADRVTEEEWVNQIHTAP